MVESPKLWRPAPTRYPLPAGIRSIQTETAGALSPVVQHHPTTTGVRCQPESSASCGLICHRPCSAEEWPARNRGAADVTPGHNRRVFSVRNTRSAHWKGEMARGELTQSAYLGFGRPGTAATGHG